MFFEPVSYTAALSAGVLSFFSPCILPLIPAYFTFITGFSLEELTGAVGKEIRKKVIFATIAYILGFSLIFILLGASASYLGGLIDRFKDVIRIGGGALIIVLGVHLTGLIRIRGLDFEKRIHVQKKPLHFMGIFVVGMAFGAGWSPCIGPLLGSVLILAGNQESVLQGIVLLGIYSAGLALPFITISIFINFVLNFVSKVSHAVKYVNMAAGILLIVLGVFLLSNRLNLLVLSG